MNLQKQQPQELHRAMIFLAKRPVNHKSEETTGG
jgi:hypothetical protein